ncbi:unnamed protein product [Soboliphyme baturini]|uniref:Uncharacterized protein n=1 Tax=Soboliphyme baturini TaxID=241478 RepID=A0A183IMF6_9BILA|nr:unnamed protein product [Soboliphyme baturini]
MGKVGVGQPGRGRPSAAVCALTTHVALLPFCREQTATLVLQGCPDHVLYFFLGSGHRYKTVGRSITRSAVVHNGMIPCSWPTYRDVLSGRPAPLRLRVFANDDESKNERMNVFSIYCSPLRTSSIARTPLSSLSSGSKWTRGARWSFVFSVAGASGWPVPGTVAQPCYCGGLKCLPII